MKAYRFKSDSTDGSRVKYIVGMHGDILEIYRTLLLNNTDLISEYEKQGWKVLKSYKGKTLLKSVVGFHFVNFLSIVKIVELLMMDNLRESK